MNREEAIAVFEEIKVNYEADPDWGVYDGVFSRGNLTEILDAYATLLCPKPDPDTGLVPCGCGSPAVVLYNEKLKCLYVQCTRCDTRSNFFNHRENAVFMWNRAMGKQEETL